MRNIAFIVYILLQAVAVQAQKEKRDIHKGNKLYEQKKYAEAEAFYKKSVEKSKESVAGNFNLGDAFYKQKKLEDAAQKFTEIAGATTDKSIKAHAYHNLGNSLLESKKLEESIEAYKKSLLNNPKDNETRYNLAYAQEKLKQQQNKDKNNKDKNQGKDNKDQKNDNDKRKDDKGNQDKNQENKDQNKKDDKEQQPQPDKLSKEDAERMLEALNNEEKNTQDKLKNKKAKGVKGKIVKDW